MKRLLVVLAALAIILTSVGLARAKQESSSGSYKILKKVKAGGEGGFDYIFADVAGRRLYVPRNGPAGLTVFNLDTLDSAGSIPTIAAGGATVDPKSHHGFSTTKPVTMWDSQTLKVIKTIDVDGRPDGIMYDPITSAYGSSAINRPMRRSLTARMARSWARLTSAARRSKE